MVNVVVLSAGPERQEVVQAPWKFIARVGVDSLKEAANNPQVHSENVKITSSPAPENGDSDGSESEGHDFDRRSVFSSETERGGVGMVNLVNVLVERSPVEGAVKPVMPSILKNEENSNLVGHLDPRRERNTGVHTKVLAHRMEEPDLGEFDGKVGEKDELRATPLLSGSGDLGLRQLSAHPPSILYAPREIGVTHVLNLVLVEVWDRIDDDPRE